MIIVNLNYFTNFGQFYKNATLNSTVTGTFFQITNCSSSASTVGSGEWWDMKTFVYKWPSAGCAASSSVSLLALQNIEHMSPAIVRTKTLTVTNSTVNAYPT